MVVSFLLVKQFELVVSMDSPPPEAHLWNVRASALQSLTGQSSASDQLLPPGLIGVWERRESNHSSGLKEVGSAIGSLMPQSEDEEYGHPHKGLQTSSRPNGEQQELNLGSEGGRRREVEKNCV